MEKWIKALGLPLKIADGLNPSYQAEVIFSIF